MLNERKKYYGAWRIVLSRFVAHLYCCLCKMLLRTFWCRLGAQLSVERKPVFICASANFSQSVQPNKYDSKHRTQSDCCGQWIFSRTCNFSTHYQHQSQARHVVTASSGFRRLTSTFLTDPGILAECASRQKRLYSSDLVKSMLKPALKPAMVSGKRVPKGPRTKQPSRTNQPSLKDDKVENQSELIHVKLLCWWLI